ncbi:hypothetical protein BC834DRAFT_847648 [Gloeopeniophorella convolvens]|nr:hypothetical protein BC834DRAFT_847648 [Gloeopeniophorella convolvens]
MDATVGSILFKGSHVVFVADAEQGSAAPPFQSSDGILEDSPPVGPGSSADDGDVFMDDDNEDKEDADEVELSLLPEGTDLPYHHMMGSFQVDLTTRNLFSGMAQPWAINTAAALQTAAAFTSFCSAGGHNGIAVKGVIATGKHIPTPPSEAAVESFHKRTGPGPSPTSLRIDWRTPFDSSWNAEVLRVLVQQFVHEVRSGRIKDLGPDSTHNRRRRILQMNRSRDTQKWGEVEVMLNQLSRGGTSDDETEDEDAPGYLKRVRRVQLKWLDKSIAEVFKRVEAYPMCLHNTGGNRRFLRIFESTQTTEARRPIKGLPVNWYDGEWLNGLTDFAKVDLSPSKAVRIPSLPPYQP